MQTVKLYGELAKRYGPEFEFDIRSPAEAIRALQANFRDFAEHLVTAAERGVAYRVVVDKKPLTDANQVHFPCSRKHAIRIIPVLHGGKSKFLGILFGAALVAAAFFVPEVALFSLGSTNITLSGILFNIGSSLLLSGVSSMLSKTPAASQSSGSQQPSYTFDGPVNTTGQGNCVPAGYGEMIVGSQVISAGLYVKEVAV